MRGIDDEADAEGAAVSEAARVAREELEAEMQPAALKTAKAFVLKWGIAFTLLMLVLWPVLSLPAGAPFPMPYFSLWVWVGIVWGFLSSVIITVLPVYESREAILKILCSMVGLPPPSSFTKKSKKTATATVDASSSTVKSGGGEEQEEEEEEGKVVEVLH